MNKGTKVEKPNPLGKITLVLKDDYELLQKEAEAQSRTAKAQAELIIRKHLKGEQDRPC